MAKSEILMWVAGIMMMIILGLAVGPTVTKSGDTAKIAVINSEINTIRSTSMLWVAQNAPDGTFNGITAEKLSPYIPGMTLTGTSTPSTLTSKVNASILYNVVPKSGDVSQMEITVTGLETISGAEASVNTSQSNLAASVVNGSDGDGKLIFDYRN